MNQLEATRQRFQLGRKHVIAMVTALVLGAVVAFALAVSRFGWNWTGFTSQIGPELRPNQPYRAEKTLWDWMRLFLIPAVLAAVGIWFNWTQNRRERRLADDRQQETTLETYLGNMANLMLHERLCVKDGENSIVVRQIALTQTLTTLQRLDSRRRTVLARFLYQSRLIDNNNPVIDLKGTILDDANKWMYAMSNRDDIEVLSRTGANLEEVDLRGVNLKGSALSGVNLKNAVMRGAYLWESDLSGANLTGADLRWANLGGANLGRADLRGAKLHHASLRGCDLSQADLRGVNWGAGADLSHAHLLGAKIDNAFLAHARLERADMEGTTNRDAKPPVLSELSESESSMGRMKGPMLEHAILVSCSLLGADLREANLRNANLMDGRFTNANMQGADLRGANLDGAELRGVDLRNANLNGAELRRADLRDANLEGAVVTNAQLAAANSASSGRSGSN